ncbi:hypothetical protein ACH5RR_007230 [Cinchona calisaya]|uniref:Uncharacterized protein n=1 Tax=Cinchona calisaya TaxID=153742 RepID=A0ABD3ARC8_9GENT
MPTRPMCVPSLMRNGNGPYWWMNEMNADEVGSYIGHDEKIEVHNPRECMGYRKPYPEWIDQTYKFPRDFRFQDFMKFLGDDHNQLRSTSIDSLSNAIRTQVHDLAQIGQRVNKMASQHVEKFKMARMRYDARVPEEEFVAIELMDICNFELWKHFEGKVEEVNAIEIVGKNPFTCKALIQSKSQQPVIQSMMAALKKRSTKGNCRYNFDITQLDVVFECLKADDRVRFL